jgi:hypothetical protein
VSGSSTLTEYFNVRASAMLNRSIMRRFSLCTARPFGARRLSTRLKLVD